MTFHHCLAFTAVAAFLAGSASAGLYPKSSSVLSITGSTYDRLIAQSNQTAIVEFYAPWCGHCKNLQPAYEKAAQNLKGLAKVAAIDCDEDSNKPFCGSMGVQGFPTLKIVKPNKKTGKPIVEDYQGPRTAKGIVDAVIEKMPNHVKRVTDKDLDGWLETNSGSAKAILFTEKGTTGALLKALAIDYLGSVSVAQIRNKDTEAVSKFGVTKFPTLLVLPAGSEEPMLYPGEMKKEPMSKFISESVGISPNPDPAPEPPKKTKAKKDKKAESKFSKASASHKSGDASSEKLKATSITIEEDPTASPDPKVDAAKPIVLPDVAPPLPTLETKAQLHASCLNPRGKICIFALLPETEDEAATTATAQALDALSELHEKLSKRSIFPFYVVSASNPLTPVIREALKLRGGQLEIIATNAKRSWARRYPGSAYGKQDLGDWIDAIKMNEGSKEVLPDSLLKDAGEGTDDAPPPAPESAPEPDIKELADPEPESPPAPADAPQIIIEDLGEVEETHEAEPDQIKETEHIIDEL